MRIQKRARSAPPRKSPSSSTHLKRQPRASARPWGWPSEERHPLGVCTLALLPNKPSSLGPASFSLSLSVAQWSRLLACEQSWTVRALSLPLRAAAALAVSETLASVSRRYNSAGQKYRLALAPQRGSHAAETHPARRHSPPPPSPATLLMASVQPLERQASLIRRHLAGPL
jgi:hypothetical protein